MTHEEIKAALLTKQDRTHVEPDSVTLDECNGSILLAFVCESYRPYLIGDIAKNYSVEVRYVDAFINKRALVGLMLTPKTATR